MTARFTVIPPLASADTWVGRRIEGTGTMRAREAQIESPSERYERDLARRTAQCDEIFRENKARRDQAARDYGEPETPHEFYHGRPGSQAEKIVIDCLRELQAIPEADRLYAHELTNAISAVYLDLAWNAPRRWDGVKIRRRTMALWELFRIGTKEKA